MSAHRSTDPLACNGSDVLRARRWLRRHGGSGDPGRLLTARLAVRLASSQTEMVLCMVLAGALVSWAVLSELVHFTLRVGTPGVNIRGPVEMAAFYLLLAGMTWWMTQRQRRAERRIAGALPRRTAHSVDRGLVRVLGGWYLLAAAVTYLGGIAVGVLLTVSAPDLANRIIGLVFAVGTLAIGLISLVVAGDAVRRPALAEDDTSLRVDDLLRTEEAHRVAPFPVIVAVVAAVNTVVGTMALWVLLGYAAVAALAWTAVYATDLARSLPGRLPGGDGPAVLA